MDLLSVKLSCANLQILNQPYLQNLTRLELDKNNFKSKSKLKSTEVKVNIKSGQNQLSSGQTQGSRPRMRCSAEIRQQHIKNYSGLSVGSGPYPDRGCFRVEHGLSVASTGYRLDRVNLWVIGQHPATPGRTHGLSAEQPRTFILVHRLFI